MHRWQAQRAAQLLDLEPGQRILDIATGIGLAARAAVESRDYCAGGKTSEWEPPSTCRTVPVVAPASGLAR
jgi:cyclopropane fatty-acyl-phospholipid synthase-like methyltransferase